MRNVIPAQPGFELVYVDAEDTPPIVIIEPVIAWVVEPLATGSTAIQAVCPSAIRDWHAVKHPNGKVFCYVTEETFDSLDEFVEVRAMREKQERDRKAAGGAV